MIAEAADETADTSLTVNNVGWFAETYLIVLEPIAKLGILPLPLGDENVKKRAAVQ